MNSVFLSPVVCNTGPLIGLARIHLEWLPFQMFPEVIVPDEVRQELLTKIARATMAKDEEAKAEAREEIKRFNEKNPGRRINPNHIMASVRGRQKRIDQAQDGVYLPKSRRDAMEAGRFALPD